RRVTTLGRGRVGWGGTLRPARRSTLKKRVKLLSRNALLARSYRERKILHPPNQRLRRALRAGSGRSSSRSKAPWRGGTDSLCSDDFLPLGAGAAAGLGGTFGVVLGAVRRAGLAGAACCAAYRSKAWSRI